MNKSQFIQNKDVVHFVAWMANILDANDSFCHAYQTKKPKNQYKFHSVYDAYQKYSWNFKYVNEQNKTIDGYTLAESTKALNNIKHLLAKSIERNDYKMCQTACLQVLKWGGVLNNNHFKAKPKGSTPIIYRYQTLQTTGYNFVYFFTTHSFACIVAASHILLI